MNIQKLIDIWTAFIYSWIPALLILWFLIARKPIIKVLPPLAGFLAGAVLSIIAGYANRYSSIHFAPGEESPLFFLLVGITEELIKFTASVAGLFMVSGGKWKQNFQNNWLAQSLSGSLGFSAAENFVYGMDGQGSIARVVPLIAHIFFAVFWGMGLYKATLNISKVKKSLFIIIGLIQGIILHAAYDSAVSEHILSDVQKVSAWLILSIAIFVTIYFHIKLIKKYEAQTDFTLIKNDEIVKPEKLDSQKKTSNLPWIIMSLFVPGSGHVIGKQEFFTGFSFFLLSALFPYILLRFAVNEFISKKTISPLGADQSLNSPDLAITILQIAIWCLVSYIAIGAWSAWEVSQKDNYKDEKKRRFSALFPITTLFFTSLIMSIFLPVFEREKEKQKAEEKKMVIKEIPLGLKWEIERTPPAPQKEIEKDSDKVKIDNITWENAKQKPNQNQKKKEKEEQSKKKVSSGVSNSDSNNMQNLPKKIPSIGLIGVQLAEMRMGQFSRAYISYVYPDTSAERAGLKAGDLIISVNGKSSSGLGASQVSSLVKGPIGTSVELIVFRDGEGEVKIKAFRTGGMFTTEESR